MNNIATKQNEDLQIKRLSAQRALYSLAKNYQGWQIILVVVLPIILVVVSAIKPNLSSYAAAYGLVIAIMDLSYFEERIKLKKCKAAKIQELFDCYVLELDASPFKKCDDVPPEDILIHSDEHLTLASNEEKIVGWYTGIDTQLPISIARIVCQRANIRWDSKLREGYINGLRIFTIGAGITLIAYGVYKDLPFNELVLFGSSLLPIFLFCIKQISDHHDAISRLTELCTGIEDLWNSILERKKSNEQLKEFSRRLQDELFEHRSRTPVIFDFIYNRTRLQGEHTMERANNILIEDLRSKGII